MRVAIVGAGFSRHRDGDRAAAAPGSRTSRSSSAATAPAGSGARTPIPAPPATCRPTSTRTRTTSAATGRSPCSPQPEILATCATPRASTASVDRIRASTEVVDARFDELSTRAGTLRTAAGEQLEADALVVACRPAQPAALARAARARRVPGRQLPLRRVGPRLRPDRQARGGDRHRRERDPVRAPGRRAGGARGRVPAHARRGCCRATTRDYPGWRAPADRARSRGCRPRRRYGMRTFMERSGSSARRASRRCAGCCARGRRRSCAASSRTRSCGGRSGPTTPSAASGSCSAPTSCRRCSGSNVELITEHVERIGERGPVTADGRRARGRLHRLRHRLPGRRVRAADAGARASGDASCSAPGRGGARRASGHRRRRLPEHVPALRPEHEPRLRLDHRDDRGPGALRRSTRCAALARAGARARGAPGGADGLRRARAGAPAPLGLDGLPQLVPRSTATGGSSTTGPASWPSTPMRRGR